MKVKLKQKKNSIGYKIIMLMLFVSLTGLAFSIIVSLANMLAIRSSYLATNRTLEEEVSGRSEDALLAQMQQNLRSLATDRTSVNAASSLERYLGIVQNLSGYITSLYQEPEAFRSQKVYGPSPENGGTYTLQFYTESDVPAEDVQEEADLLGNVEYIFDPVIRNNEDVITTIYLATESGILLSYDPDSDRANSPYYDFKETEWYQAVMKEGKPLYTDVYKGAYGWGLMTTCAAPFYGADGEITGVVCIDLQLEDIQRELVSVDISEHASAYLVDRYGNLIAGPDVDYSTESFRQLSELNSSPEFEKVAAGILAQENGVSEVEGKFYAYAPIDHVDWSLIIIVPKEDILQPVTEMLDTINGEMEESSTFISRRIMAAVVSLILVLLLSVALIVYMAVRFTGRLVEPLQSMRRQVRVISGGELDVRVKVESDDEVGELAEEFNQMASSLKEHIEQIRMVTAEKERIGAELSVAKQIQANMLPNIFPPFPERTEFDIYASMTPAREVGGDFYDFFLVDEDHLAVVMADVSGKGVPAALFMVIAKTLIKDCVQMGRGPAEAFAEVNNKLCESNDEGMFVTAWLGLLEISTGKMAYVNAGHNPPLIGKKKEGFAYLKMRPGFVLAGMEDMSYKSGELFLEEGDVLFLYTDGVTEAARKDNVLYGEERLRQILNAHTGKRAEELVRAVGEDIGNFVEGADQFDDITMLALQITESRDARKEGAYEVKDSESNPG